MASTVRPARPRAALTRCVTVLMALPLVVRVLGSADTLNQSLEKAGRVADFLELGELMCIDALHRRESCGGHFRVESQTEDGEALRHDDEFAYVANWEFTGIDETGALVPTLHKEELVYKFIELKQRSYK